MPRANIYFDIKEDEIIKSNSDKWNLSKEETIKKMIREFGGKE